MYPSTVEQRIINLDPAKTALGTAKQHAALIPGWITYFPILPFSSYLAAIKSHFSADGFYPL